MVTKGARAPLTLILLAYALVVALICALRMSTSIRASTSYDDAPPYARQPRVALKAEGARKGAPPYVRRPRVTPKAEGAREGGKRRQSSNNPERESRRRLDKQNVTVGDDRPQLPCTLRKRPVPMILMSLGRSGSASMFQVLSKLTGSNNHHLLEYTGGGTEVSKRFFQSIPPKDVNGNWIVKFMCWQQHEWPDSGVVGFKWKPYETLFTEEAALQGLKLLARLKEPQIKVVRSRRNLLDVHISRRKHQFTHRRNETIDAHCQVGDEECIQTQLKAGAGIELPTRRLLKELKVLNDMEQRTDRLLAAMNVPTVHISYEKLFLAGDDTSEWARVFDFLGVGPLEEELTADAIKKAGHAATSVPFHNRTLSNYLEVREVLLGTEFEPLLH